MNAALHLTPTRLLLLFSGDNDDGGVCAGGKPWDCGSQSTGKVHCTWTDSRGCVASSRRGGGVKKQMNKPSIGGEACCFRYYFLYERITHILHQHRFSLLLFCSGGGGVCARGKPWNCGSQSTGKVRCTWTDSRGCVASSGHGHGDDDEYIN